MFISIATSLSPSSLEGAHVCALVGSSRETAVAVDTEQQGKKHANNPSVFPKRVQPRLTEATGTAGSDNDKTREHALPRGVGGASQPPFPRQRDGEKEKDNARTPLRSVGGGGSGECGEFTRILLGSPPPVPCSRGRVCHHITRRRHTTSRSTSCSRRESCVLPKMDGGDDFFTGAEDAPEVRQKGWCCSLCLLERVCVRCAA